MSALAKGSAARVVPHTATRLQRFAAVLVYWLVRGVAATCRFHVVDPSDALGQVRKEPVVFAIWHNRLAFSLILQHRLFLRGPGGRRLAALVSASRDGALLAAVLRAFGVEPVRGSSSRRGAQALVEMKTWAERGLNLAITPDGPRGPRYRVQHGIVALARIVRRPIVPVALNVRWRWTARSWDRFQVPLPFARCEVRVGVPLRVDPDGDDAAMETAREELQSRLAALSRD